LWLEADGSLLNADELVGGNIVTSENTIISDNAAARSINPPLLLSSHRLPHNFFEGGNTVSNFMEAGFTQRDHAVIYGPLAQFQR
jgi:hypothetical protein